MEGEVKGLWLVDFGNGQGVLLLAAPRGASAVLPFYGDGFAGRMKVMSLQP